MVRVWNQIVLWRWPFLAGLLLVLFATAGHGTPDPENSLIAPRLPFRPKLNRVRILLSEKFAAVTVQETSASPSVTIRVARGQIHLTDSSGKKLAEPGTGFLLKPATGRLIRFQNTVYRGSVEAFLNPMGVPVLVNNIRFDDYLKGVVPKELNPLQFPEKEAIKAQSVAARTFAMSEMGRRASHGYHLFSDERSQVYGGAVVEKEMSNEAVDETHGLYLSHQGAPITAFFSSTCGGKTASYAGAFQRPEIDYLKGGFACPDDASPYHKWNTVVLTGDIQVLLDRYAGVGRLKEIEFLKRDTTGRASEMRFVGDKGQSVVQGLRIRYALGLRSHFITSINSKKDKRGYISQLSVSGRGFGHGVGMCQFGAVGLARRGLSFSEILKRYYPGTKLVSLPGDQSGRVQL